MKLQTICILLSSLSFIFYAISYFVGTNMKNEFKRFNLEKLGLLVIILEILGALGLLVGIWYKPLLIFSAAGLALLMLLGVIVRFNLKDSLWITIPALFYMCLNAFIFYLAWL
jgi:DoxX-like family